MSKDKNMLFVCLASIACVVWAIVIKDLGMTILLTLSAICSFVSLIKKQSR